MLGKLFLLFTLTTTVELYMLVQLGARMGVFWTLMLILATGAMGAWLAKREGLRALGRIQAEVARGQLPGDSLLDGLCVLIAGAFLLTPGVLTDVAGFLLLIPAARIPLKAALVRRLERSIREGIASGTVTYVQSGPGGISAVGGNGWPSPTGSPRTGAKPVHSPFRSAGVDSEVIDVTDP